MFLLRRTAIEGKSSEEVGEQIKQLLKKSPTSNEVVKLAQKSGYVVAVRKDPNKGDIRIKAVPGKGIDLTPIERKVRQMDSVGRWYFHPGKTMLLNGSSKDSSRLPSPLTLQQIMTLFEQLPQ